MAALALRAPVKSLLVVAAGMADLPHPALKGRTPLAEARTPNADRIAKEGRLASALFHPEETLSILGYDPRKAHPGRGALEAAGRGILPAAGEAVFLADFCTVSAGTLVDAGVALKPEEVRILCDLLNTALGRPEIRFIPGSGSRAFLLAAAEGLAGAACASPAETLDRPVRWPEGAGTELLRSVMEESHRILDGHEVNAVRRDLGENPANLVWLWGPGGRAALPLLSERIGIKAAMAAGSDLGRGVGKLTGMTVVETDDGDPLSAARAALGALSEHDLVVLRVEAAERASHTGETQAKIDAIQKIDAEVLGTVLGAAPTLDARVALVCDRPVSTERRADVSGEVPVSLWGKGFEPRREGLVFDEASAAKADLRFEAGHEFLEYFLEHR